MAIVDAVLAELADYVMDPPQFSEEAYRTARLDLWDAMGCAAAGLSHPACRQRVSPLQENHPGQGVPIPGTGIWAHPADAAFAITAAVRWLDYNDTWLAAEWGHPSDNLGAILAAADWVDRRGGGQARLTIGDVLSAMIQAHEIQGVLALDNSLNAVGRDHTLWVEVAAAGVATRLLGGGREAVLAALSHAFIDAGSLRTYRHAGNVTPRKSWAAGDATARALRLATLAVRGEEACPTALTAPGWGFNDAVLGGRAVRLARPLGCYVMENVLFKVAFPAEFHGQTAVEAALALYPQVRGRWEAIARVEIATQAAARRIIDKTGPLVGPADRDHCLQYMVAVALLHGRLTAADYLDPTATDPRIDALREKMVVREEPQFSRDYLDPDKRSVANTVQVVFADGSRTEPVTVEYPLGHRRRRSEATPRLRAKLRENLAMRFAGTQLAQLSAWADDPAGDDLPVHRWMDAWHLPAGF